MSDEKFEGIEWLGDAIGGALEIPVTSERLDCESWFQQRAILIVKVGSDERPASEEDIKNVQECITIATQDWPRIPFTIVTHHAIDFSVLETDELMKVIKAVRNED